MALPKNCLEITNETPHRTLVPPLFRRDHGGHCGALFMSPKEFGRAVKMESAYHGVSFTDLANECKISKATLSRIWNGKGNPTLRVMNRIAKRLFFEIGTNL